VKRLRIFDLCLAISSVLCAIILATPASAQLSATAPSPNAQSVYAGDSVSFTVSVSGQQGSPTYNWQFSVNGAPYAPLTDGLQMTGETLSGSSTPNLSIANAQVNDTGRYRCLVSDSVANVNSGPGTLTVAMPAAPTATPPSDVTAARGDTAIFTVNASGNGRLTYQWQVSHPAGATFVNVTDGDPMLGPNMATLAITSVSAGDAGWYRCLVSNAGGTVNSGRATLTVLASPPASLTASTVSSTAVNLSWTNTDPDAQYVVIERAPCSTSAFCTAVQIAPSLTTFQDGSTLPGQGLSPSTTYTYRAYSMYAADSLTSPHAYSSQTSATTMAATLPVTQLVASPATPTQINLTWVNHDPTATNINIERQVLTTSTSTPFNQIASLPAQPAPTLYQDNNNGAGLPPQTAFNYRAYVVSPRGVSAYSNTSMSTTLSPPAPPQSVQATMISSDEIDLSWTNSDPTVNAYLIERQLADGSFSALATVTGVATHFYADKGLTPATQYTYRMRAQSPAGTSDYSTTAAAITGNAPPAPTNFRATGVSPIEVDLTWTNPAGAFDHLLIERKQFQHAAETGIATLAPHVSSFQDMKATPATQYIYRISTVDSAGTSSAYELAGATTLGVPAPTNFRTTLVTASRIDLQWDNAFAYDGLHLYKQGPTDPAPVKSADLPGTATSYELGSLLTSTTYTLSLQADISGVLSPFVNLVVTTGTKITIFFVHGASQRGGSLDGLALALKSAIDPGGLLYNFDSGFDWSRCADSLRAPYPPVPFGEDGPVGPNNPPFPGAPNRCPNNCNVSDVAFDLARYIALQNPPGDVFIVAYSLGGLVARDMIEGQQGAGIGQGRKLLGLVTLATPNNGFPYEYPWDNWGICDGLGKEIASDLRASPPYYPYSPYIPSINHNWVASPLGGAGYQAFPWMVAAGTFCQSPIRFPDSTQNGCPAGSTNDGAICTDSALFNGISGPYNMPTTYFTSDAYSHSADPNFFLQLLNGGNDSLYYGGNCDMRQHISIWDPGAGSALAQAISGFIKTNTP
jgi:fibronectin type 3 domain-containing protein